MELTVEQPITKDNHFKICFVCLGNICRSPTAQGVFQHLVDERGLSDYFEIDSSGTSAYHEGESANSHSQSTANKHGIELHSKARRFKSYDLDYFDLIIPIDNENLANINRMGQDKQEHIVELMRDFDPEKGNEEVPDPYNGGNDGFERVFGIIKRSSEQLLDELEKHISQ